MQNSKCRIKVCAAHTFQIVFAENITILHSAFRSLSAKLQLTPPDFWSGSPNARTGSPVAWGPQLPRNAAFFHPLSCFSPQGLVYSRASKMIQKLPPIPTGGSLFHCSTSSKVRRTSCILPWSNGLSSPAVSRKVRK